MQRLLMGEVGSGKTVVALYALLRAVEHGMQGALMAPTETLAEQHFATLQALVPEALLPAALLTGSTPARRRAELLGKLASGELKLVVGTHALIESDVEFDRLAVAVVDEQHRFGVRQRAALDRKGPGETAPHVLHMTATPIPRTLALTAYGDLDVTRLCELPRGRQPIATHVASSEAERARAYERIREELRAGRQAYVVCPLVEESDRSRETPASGRNPVSASSRRARRPPSSSACARASCASFRLELLHGQLRPAREARRRWRGLQQGAADVLVATTVIEVGIDVPNATVMLVENAERYGISQLHQLRGRIGRGEHPSVCLLFGSRAMRAGCVRSPSTATASRSPRSTCSCAARASSRARASTARPSPAWRACRRTRSCWSAPASGPSGCSTPTRRSRPPSTRCWAKRWSARWARRRASRSRREGGGEEQPPGAPCCATVHAGEARAMIPRCV